MTHTFTIQELEAVALAAYRGATRLHLQGVLFELYDDGTASLIATDGHRLHAIRARIDAQPFNSAVLPNAAIKTLVTLAKAACDTLSSFDRRHFRIRVNIRGGFFVFCMVHVDAKGVETPVINTIKHQFAAQDGNFPDWRRVVHEKSDAAQGALKASAAYIADFGKAAKLLGDKLQAVEIAQTIKEGVYAVRVNNDDFMGILMGIR